MIAERFERLRAGVVADKIAPHLQGFDGPVLDFGAGSGLVAEQIVARTGLEVVPVDVINENRSALDMVIYDGRELPFDDDHFDVSMALFVMHHVQEPRRVLSELARVSKHKIVLFEDTPKNAVQYYLWRWFDYLRNHRRNPDINVANHDFFRPEYAGLHLPDEYPITPSDVEHHYSHAMNGALYRQSIVDLDLVETTDTFHPDYWRGVRLFRWYNLEGTRAQPIPIGGHDQHHLKYMTGRGYGKPAPID
jgi:SAM-dependent methyltransferase